MPATGENHLVTSYDAELKKLEQRVIKMAELVMAQLEQVPLAIADSSEGLASRIVEGDELVNNMELKADKLIIQILAKRAPMGNDLRFIVAVSRMVTELEHLGDEAAIVAKTLLQQGPISEDSELAAGYVELASLMQLAVALLAKIMSAFEQQEFMRAQEVAYGGASAKGDLAKRIAILNESTLKQKMSVAEAVNLVLATRSLERIVRLIRNVGEHVIYLMSGTDVRHQAD